MALIEAFHDALTRSDAAEARAIGAQLLAHQPAYPDAIRTFVERRLSGLPATVPAEVPAPAPLSPDLSENPDRALLQGEFPLATVPVEQVAERFHDYADLNLETRPFRTLAFYLPQFHPFPENDAWWGKGFTEWTNVGKATPVYQGHYQPHCPIHFGYYDLRLVENMVEQARLARNYGIDGFSYYFYWFDGAPLMELPLRNMLGDKRVDIPFCLTWANENWTRRWDGQENEILIAQKHSPEDSRKLIEHLIAYFSDERYIRINSRPVLIVYRADIIPEIEATTQMWREVLSEHGFPGLYLIAAQTFGITDPRELGFDAAVEFPPHAVQSGDVRGSLPGVHPNFDGHIFSYKQVVSAKADEPAARDYVQHRTAMLSWDNTARKSLRSHVFHGFSLSLYQSWLRMNICLTLNCRQRGDQERLVFINAWNEWAEGTHLEPDRRYGYGYLQSTADVLKDYCGSDATDWLNAADPRRTHAYRSLAVFVHVHYLDIWPELLERISAAGLLEVADLFITTDTVYKARAIHTSCPQATIDICENRGRDVLPFLKTLGSLHQHPYATCLKLHTKKSDYRADGAEIRDELLSSLLPSRQGAQEVIRTFASDSGLGLLAPTKYLIKHNDRNLHFNHGYLERLCNDLGIGFRRTAFPAGSMFWFRPAALTPLLRIPASRFEGELGLADGTAAHAVERLFALVAEEQGFRCAPC